MKRFLSILLTIVLTFTLLPGITLANTTEKIKGVWVCTTNNLDFPSQKGLNISELKSELGKIVYTCKAVRLNTIFFQVRPNSDALYKSDIFPWSAVLTGIQGQAPDDGFDPLEYIIKIAHENGIELHAWINPYRIGKDELADSNPAKQHPEYTVECSDGNIYYNPALPEVRDIVIDGVKEIVRNYDVDGIHFDDYFYPYNVTDYPDAEDYEKYGGDFSDVADFRRDNVNKLIKDTYKAVHSINTAVVFGVSPFGIWDNKSSNPDGSDTSGMSSYSSIYADSRAWVLNGWVDYICPQIYWSFENESAPFDKLVKWWQDLCNASDTMLYIGIAAYKLGTDESGWGIVSQTERQQAYCDSLAGVNGTVYFRYYNIAENTLGITDMLKNSYADYVTTVPVQTNTLEITSPVNGYTTTDANVSVTGICNPLQPLTIDGKTVTVTEHGYFSAYLPLSIGNNTFTIVNGNSKGSVTVVRKTVQKRDILQNTCFKKDSAYPVGDCTFSGNETVEFQVCALEGSKIYIENNGTRIRLEPSENINGFVTYLKKITMPNTVAGNIDMGEYSFVALYNGTEYVLDTKANITLLSKPKQMYTYCESYIYDEWYYGSMMDNYSVPQGSPVTVTASVGTRSRMQNGKWIETENLTDTCDTGAIDIDIDKYTRLNLTLEANATFETFITSNGTLVIDLYSTSYNNVTLDKNDNLSTEVLKNGAHTIVTVRHKADFAVTGFRVIPDKGGLTVWVYDKKSTSISGKTIVIDPGHGGNDIGAMGPAGTLGACESALNLSLSYILKEKLEEQNATVILTRTDDSTLLLSARADLTRSYTPDICISVHHNSVSQTSDFSKASGAVALYSRNTAKPLADIISKNITNNLTVKNDGAKTQSLNICRDYRYPCVLIECGFVCNPAEYEYLLTDAYKNTLCDNIVQSLCEYFE